MALELYKPEEATRSRGGIAVLCGAILLYGVFSLYEYLAGGFWQMDLTRGAMGDEFPIGPRDLLCGVLVVVCAIGIYALCNHRRVVDFLIDTEAEMQKVSWPPRNEVISSSIVVVLCVIILAVYLGVVDYGLVLVRDKVPWDRLWG